MELPQCGVPCSHTQCRRLDFLPYTCNVCHLPFCDQHIHHGCASDQQTQITDAAVPKKNTDNGIKCAEEGCADTRAHMLIKCGDCGEHYCVTHRHINCPNVAAPRVAVDPAIAAAEMYKYAKETVDQQVNLNIEKARKKSKNAEMANKVQLMRLKSKATGLPSIPTQDRAYFLIKVGQEKNEKQEYPIYVSTEWTVGRSIDTIAAACKLKNQNNLSNSAKLRLFRSSDNRILTQNLSDRIIDLFNKSIISNGETLNIDYV